MPLSLWVSLFLTSALVTWSRNGWFARERQPDFGEGAVSGGGHLEF